MADVPNRPEYQSERFRKGLEVGRPHADAFLACARDVDSVFGPLTTEIARKGATS